jgi:hypothetical protein
MQLLLGKLLDTLRLTFIFMLAGTESKPGSSGFFEYSN